MSLEERQKKSGSIFDLDRLRNEVKKIEDMMSSPSFWEKGQEEISKISKRLSLNKEKIEEWEKINREIEDLYLLAEMFMEEGDDSSLKEISKDLFNLEKKINEMEIQSLFKDPDDMRNAIVSINAGAGGTDAQDWVQMLLRMYLRWCEDKGFKTKIIDSLPGDEAGLKNVTFTVEGPYAYGKLKAEHGIHRLVRISPFDATRRRHTSFASVSVYPEVDTDIKIEINEKDLRIDTFRASGPGGQHVNTTSSAVRIVHIPTGIVVQCQNERSQHRNKEIALKILKAQLYELEKKKLEQKKKEIHESQKDISWGNQIRSYILNPYRLVKDHRTNVEIGDIERVMDGDLDPFINAYLKMKARPE